MTETKNEYRCETCQNNNCDLSNASFEKAKKENILYIGRIMVMRCTTEIHGCFSHSAIAKQNPPYQALVDHIRWTQNLWRHGIEIMRKNNLVIASDTPMEKLAFTFYMDLCEIDSRALHLFCEGPGDENYKDQTVIQAWEIVPYPRPYEEAIKQAAREELLDILDLECEEIKSRIESSAMGQPLSEESRGRIVGLLDARVKIKSLRSTVTRQERERQG